MNRSRALTGLLLAGIIAGSLFSGCTHLPGPAGAPTAPIVDTATPTPLPASTAPAPTLTPSPQPHLQVEAANLRGLQVEFWHPWTGEAANQVAEITAAFNQSNVWGIHAHALDLGGHAVLAERVRSILGDDEGPNVVAAGNEQLLSWQQQASVLINLEDYAKDAYWGMTLAEIADFPPNFWAGSASEDRRYGIPATRSAQVLFYNQSWAEELGFSHPPANLQELEAQACAAAQANLSDAVRENDGTGGWIVSGDALVMLAWMHSFGADPPADPQTGAFRFNRPAVQETYAFLRKLYDQNCAWSSRLPTPYDYFATRHALFYSGSLEDIQVQQRAQQRHNSADAWSVLPYPADGRKPVVLTNDIQYAVFVGSREQQLASWLFIRWLTLPENQARLARASGAWPASVEAMELLSDYRQELPQWGQTLLWIPMATPAPTQPAWRIARRILEDASWNVFRPGVEPAEIPQILSLLDATIREVLEKTGQS